MFKHILIGVGLFFSCSAIAQESDSWGTYLENDQIIIRTRISDCHYPEKGVHNRYLVFRIENLTSKDIDLGYELKRAYNGKWIEADRKQFDFNIPAKSAVESSCDKLTKGLYVFSSMIEPKTESKLSGFEFSDLTINGKTIAQ